MSCTLLELVCNTYLHTGMMNSGVIDVSLGYEAFRILVRPRHLKELKQFFHVIFMILVMPSFSLHCYYAHNFENHYWILRIQYQFIITIREILLNTTQNKRINWSNSISYWGQVYGIVKLNYILLRSKFLHTKYLNKKSLTNICISLEEKITEIASNK